MPLFPDDWFLQIKTNCGHPNLREGEQGIFHAAESLEL